MKSTLHGAILAVLSARSVLALGVAKSCSNPQLSCQNTSPVTDTCCFNTPGGQLVQTQFWDSSPSTGPSTSWTIHGLWPDHCDGTYDSNCDASRAYTGIGSILTSFGKADLLAYMSTYWKDINGNDETFWEHEWAKHGTCVSTLNPSCYTNYTPKQELVDFLQRTVDLFKSLDSYGALAAAGIVPSTSQTYTSAQIVAALKVSFGYEVTLGCSSGALNELWYAYNVRGSLQLGTFVPSSPDGSKSTCPATGVKYLPKSGAPSPPTTLVTTTSTGPVATGTGGAVTGSGYLQAYTSGSNTGCLISAGTWYTTGSCATYKTTASGSGFTLSSSKGPCGITGSKFACASGTSATVFTLLNGNLATGGSSTFYSAAVPSGSTQQAVYTTSNNVAVTFQWQSL